MPPCVGITGRFVRRNVDFLTQADPTWLADPAHCPAHPPSRRGLLELLTSTNGGKPSRQPAVHGAPHMHMPTPHPHLIPPMLEHLPETPTYPSCPCADSPIQADPYLSRALVSLLVSVGGAMLIGLGFIVLVTKRPALLVGIAIGIQVRGRTSGGRGGALGCERGCGPMMEEGRLVFLGSHLSVPHPLIDPPRTLSHALQPENPQPLMQIGLPLLVGSSVLLAGGGAVSILFLIFAGILVRSSCAT